MHSNINFMYVNVDIDAVLVKEIALPVDDCFFFTV